MLASSDSFAFSTRAVTKDNGTTVVLPLLTLTKSTDELVVAYKDAIRTDGEGLKGIKDEKFKE
jgi:hypothetical protein